MEMSEAKAVPLAGPAAGGAAGPAAGPAARVRMRRRPPCRSYDSERSRELSGRIGEKGRAVSKLLSTLLSDLAEFNRQEGWRADGAVSARAWVMQNCGVSGATASLWVRSATNLEQLPQLGAALANGSLSLDAVAPLAEIATPETDGELAEASAHWSIKQIRELGAHQRGVADATAARRFEQRAWNCNDDRRTMWIAFTDEDYAEAKAFIMGQISDRWLGNAGTSGEGVSDPVGFVPLHQQLYDGMMDLFHSGAGAGGAAGYRPTVVVHAPLELLLGIGGGAGRAEIQGVGPIATEVALRLTCDANITMSVHGKDGSVLDQGRARRHPTPAQRIEIARRDKGCRFPDCLFTEFTHVHHVRHWTKGGETNLDNLITLCSRHHHAVHELGWKMNGTADDVMTFTSPAGHVMSSVPSPTWRNSPMRR